jgi:hypothetical protein
MRTISYISLSLTLAWAFCLWLPNNLAFAIIWFSSFLLPFLIAGDVFAIYYMCRHWKEKGVKGLAGLLAAIIVIVAIGLHSPWNSVSDRTMSRHFHKHENDLRELVKYAESLTDSVSLSFPSDPIPQEIQKDEYDQVILLLGKTSCKKITTFSFWDKCTLVYFRPAGFSSHGYLFLPDGTVKILHWDPLGSDWSGLYDIN